jgi:adenylyltransferase/sulfurtransferase
VHPIGKKGQQTIRASQVAVIGAGALGSVVCEQLVRAGVGTLTVIDHDVVELQNLQRQVLYTEDDVGRSKIDAICKRLRGINSDVDIKGIDMMIDADSALPEYLLIDCTDNFAASRAINHWCIQHSLPWIHGSAAGVRGTVASFVPDGFCFECIYGSRDTNETAATSGMLAGTAGGVASLQVVQALKHIVGQDADEMFIVNIWLGSIEKVHVHKREGCICIRKHP